MKACLTAIAIFVLVLFVSGLAQAAETTASIIGTVRDDSGAVVPGATVTAVNADTNFTRVTSTEATGFYRLALLPPGDYSVNLELEGFARESRKNILLTVGKEIQLDFALRLSTSSELIEVSGETPLIDATKSQISQTVEEKSIRSLPLNGRDYTQLSLLAPGVKPVTLTNYGQFQIGGQRGDAVNYTIDGGENNFSYTNESRSSFTQEGIREFQILTNSFSAEYGRSTSGVINVVSKSGTNELHGNGFFFFRADELDSQNFFATTEAPFDQQQGGATLGGPIIPNKTFFFTAYEQSNTDRTISVVNPVNPSGKFIDRPAPIDRKLLTAKVDHQLNNDNSMVFRYNLEDRHTNGFYAGGAYVDGVDQNIRSQSFAISETSVMSNNTYNEALIQYGRFLRTDDPEIADRPAEYRPNSVTGHHYCCPQVFEENRIEVLDTFTKVFNKRGEHTMKFGADYIHIDSTLTFAQYIGGAYFFDSDAPFDPNNPSTFPSAFYIGQGNPTNEDTNHQFSMFIQDDWRVSDRLTLNLGLRYDIEKFNGPNSDQLIPPVDKNNFGPRVGFNWDSSGDGSMIVRGGYGRYFKPVLHNVYNNALLFDGQRYVILGVENPSYPNPPDPSTLERVAPDIRPLNDDFQVAYSDQISLGMQRELGKDLVFSADYVFVRGGHLTRERNLNAPRNLVNPEPPPFPEFNRYRLLLTDAGSWYHGLQLGFQKRYSENLMFNASYTLSKVTEDAADFFSIAEPNNQFDLAAEKGPGTHDQRHVFAFSAIYDLPMDFQVGTIVRGASGIPINFILADNHNKDGFSSNDRPDLGPDGSFIEPPADRPGNLPRNFGRGESFFQVDFRVARSFKWSDYSLEVIGEVFNLFNRVNFNFRPATVINVVGSENLGGATEAFDPRQVQFGFKFNF